MVQVTKHKKRISVNLVIYLVTAAAVPKSPREVAKGVTDTVIGEEEFRGELGSGSGNFLGLFGSRKLIRSEIGGRRGSVEIRLTGFTEIGAVT